MKCSEAMRHLHAYAMRSGGNPDDPVYRHFQECSSCGSELALQRKILDAMKDMPFPVKSDAQWQELNRAILSKLQPASKTVRFPSLKPAYKWAVAALLVLSLISFNLIISLHRQSLPSTGAIDSEVFPRISHIEGNVFSADTLRSGKEITVEKHSPILSGHMFRTGENSVLNMQIDKTSSLQLSGNSRLEIVQCVENSQIFKLEDGKVKAEVGKRGAGRVFRVETPNAACEVVGTRFCVSVERPGGSESIKTVLSVEEGLVRFKTRSGKEMFVEAGKSAEVIGEQFSAPEKKCDTRQINRKKDSSEKIDKDSASDDPRLASALRLIESGEFGQALDELQRILSDTSVPSKVRAIALKKAALCFKITGKPERSLEALRTIAEGRFSRHEKESALFESANLLSTSFRKYDESIKEFRAYIKRYPDGIWIEEALFALAELLHLQKDFENAADVYKKLISDYPGSSRVKDALYSLARIYSRDMKDCDRALGYFGRIENDFPESDIIEDALFWKGDCLFNQGRASQAIAQYNRYLEKYPDGKWAAEAKARVSVSEVSGVQ